MGMLAILALCLALQLATADSATYNVVRFGAVGNGRKDDTKAFLKAWSYACADSSSPTYKVPAGRTFLVNRILFNGPCKSNIHVQVLGNIVAPIWNVRREGTGSWILFKGVNNLVVDGKGDINGRGYLWWNCKKNRNCPSLIPDAFGFMSCNNSRLSGLSFTNAPAKHVTVYACYGFKVQGIKISAPDQSPNTDGILVQQSEHVLVASCNIGSGDDCVAVGPGSVDVNITNVSCGPGHGISIGSLGKDHAESTVEGIHISNCSFYNTSNGVRIKTWQGGRGYARRMSFEKLKFNAVQYPIIIDQYYCPKRNCGNHTSAVQLSDVRFVGARGTASGGAAAISLACSKTVACTRILLKDVRIVSATRGERVGSYCLNAHGNADGVVLPPVPCLK